jgi:ABC-type glycerol-3-phosphate transport system permease component
LRQFFIQIPSELWDSAQIDGAGHLRFLGQVAIPLARPAILTVSLFTFIGSWNALAWPILVTSDPEWRPISYGLSSFVQEAGALVHLQMAGSVITILPILIMYLLIQRRFTEGIATTGLKG